MRILLACDKLSSFENIYFDFKRAGFPDAADICVLSVADVFVPPGYTKTDLKRSSDQAYLSFIDKEIESAHQLADRMGGQLRSRFPHWRLHTYSVGGSPAEEIIKKAQDWMADLIVVGSHGRPGVGEFFFGSVALKVLAGSACSVRVVRKGPLEEASPSRIIVGVDGSAQNEYMINQIGTRHWKEGSSVHLITAVNMMVDPAIFSDSFNTGPFLSVLITPENQNARKEWQSSKDHKQMDWIKRMHSDYQSRLERSGLYVSSLIQEGDPKVLLLKEAQRWGADCIYMAAVGHSQIERLLIGSVSVASVIRAQCSVEVLRKRR
ncbi:MAG: universal stress protein [Candidatus Omnitrophica bacterium]|nr:universal stress protein [Candidatus Omnitrophota bacterium]